MVDGGGERILETSRQLGPFEVDGVLRVFTASSVWTIDADYYVRLPRREQPRAQTESCGGRLDDAVRHPYHDLWWMNDAGHVRLRILPVIGPADGYGILTGVVEDVIGPWIRRRQA